MPLLKEFPALNKPYIFNSLGHHFTPKGENVQKAIDDLGTDGGWVRIPSKTLEASSKIVIENDGVDLGGLGMYRSQIKAADDLNDDILEVTGKYCSVHDLALNGNSANQTAGNGLYLYGVDLKASVYNLYVTDCRYHGILVSGSKCRLRNVYSELNRECGIQVGASRNTFIQCYCEENKMGGWHLTFAANENHLSHCEATLNKYSSDWPGAFRIDGDRNVIVATLIAENEGHGIYMVRALRTVIHACIIMNNGTLANNTYDGINLFLGSKYNLVNACHIYSEVTPYHRYGYRESSTSDDYNIITSNIIEGSATANLSIQGPNTISANNIA